MIWGNITKLRLKHNRTWSFYLVKKVDDANNHGECDPNKKIMLVRASKSQTCTHFNAVHEILHALSDEYEINLTEKQVEKLEKAIRSLYRLNEGFSLDPP